MNRRHWTSVFVVCALVTAAPLAQNRPPRGAVPTASSPPWDDLRTEKLKTEALADVDAMQTFTQQMVDSIFSFGELGFQEVETNRYQGRQVRAADPAAGHTGHRPEQGDDGQVQAGDAEVLLRSVALHVVSRAARDHYPTVRTTPAGDL